MCFPPSTSTYDTSAGCSDFFFFSSHSKATPKCYGWTPYAIHRVEVTLCKEQNIISGCYSNGYGLGLDLVYNKYPNIRQTFLSRMIQKWITSASTHHLSSVYSFLYFDEPFIHQNLWTCLSDLCPCFYHSYLDYWMWPNMKTYESYRNTQTAYGSIYFIILIFFRAVLFLRVQVRCRLLEFFIIPAFRNPHYISVF